MPIFVQTLVQPQKPAYQSLLRENNTEDGRRPTWESVTSYKIPKLMETNAEKRNKRKNTQLSSLAGIVGNRHRTRDVADRDITGEHLSDHSNRHRRGIPRLLHTLGQTL